MLSPGYGRTAVLMNSQQLWLSAQDQTSQHYITVQEVFSKHPDLAEDLLAADGRERSIFFWGTVLVGCLCSCGQSPTRVYAGSTN